MRTDVGQDQITDLGLIFQQCGLDGGAQGDDLIRIERAPGRLLQRLLHKTPDQGHARRSAHQDHVMGILEGGLAVAKRLSHRPRDPLHKVGDQRGELAGAAGAPTITRPSSRTPTTDGVKTWPEALGISRGRPS